MTKFLGLARKHFLDIKSFTGTGYSQPLADGLHRLITLFSSLALISCSENFKIVFRIFSPLALLVIEQNWIFNFSKNGYVLISIRPCERGKIINTVIFVGTIIWFSVGLHTVVMCIDLYPSILLLVTWTIFQGTAASKNWNCWKMYCLVCSYPVKLRLCMIVKYRHLRIRCIFLFDIGIY